MKKSYKSFIEHLRDVVVSPTKEQLNTIEQCLGWKRMPSKKKLYTDSLDNIYDLKNALFFQNHNDKALALLQVFKHLHEKYNEKKNDLSLLPEDGNEKEMKYRKNLENEIFEIFIERLDTLLYLEEAIRKNLFEKNTVVSNVFKKKKKKKEEVFENLYEKESISLVKKYLDGNVLYELFYNHIPFYPVATSLTGFEMLEWQKMLLTILSKNRNVIVSTPTSSGKTFIIISYLILVLKRNSNKKLYYCAPNNTLAFEVATMFHKIIELENKVSYVLDNQYKRLQDEKIIVFTPQGAICHTILDTIDENGIFCLDEVHSIGQNILGEIVLHKFSHTNCQKILLSATLSDTSIHKLVSILGQNNTDVIKTNTRFMVHQKWVITTHELVPYSPIGSLHQDILQTMFDELDLALTPYDAYLFYENVKNIIPEHLQLKNYFQTIKRYDLEDVQKWIYKILQSLQFNKNSNNIFQKFKMNVLQDDVLDYQVENVFPLIQEMKKKNLFPALFFHSNEADAIHFAIELTKQLHKIPVNEKDMEKRIKAQDIKRKEMEKMLKNAEKAPLSHGEKKDDRKHRIEKLKEELENLTHSFEHQIDPLKSLAEDNQIEFYHFETYSSLMCQWDSNLKKSHLLVQMIMFGIGILLPSMSSQLQSFIRNMYSSGHIKLVMTDKCMAYGINTPTRTCIISPELDIIDQIQASGRAGRKGYEKQGNIIFFKQKNIMNKDLVLPNIQHKILKIYHPSLLPSTDENWFSSFILQDEIKNISPTNGFSENAVLFEKASLLLPYYTDIILNDLQGESNKTLKFILGMINLLPEHMSIIHNELQQKEWKFSFTSNVTKFFIQHNISTKPNRFIHDYLMNMLYDVSIVEKKKLISCSSYWENLIELLKMYYKEQHKISFFLDECLQFIIKSKIRCLCI